MEEKKTLLELNNVTVGFPKKQAEKPHRVYFNPVVHDLSFSLKQGEILGIVGESGSGKSVSMLSMLGLLSNGGKVMSGSIRLRDIGEEENWIELTKLDAKGLCGIRGDDISMIFQEPMTSLNPLMTIGDQVEEMLVLHGNYPEEERHTQVLAMLTEAGLLDVEALCEKYPHELSGGMRQRVMIAMAMICKPRLLIADEPTTALDVTIQAKILKLLAKFREEYGTTIILISHDLGVIRSICDRALVMYAGRLVEQGDVETLFENPQEDYTKKLLSAALGKGKIISRTAKETDEKKVLVNAESYSVYYTEKAKKLFEKNANGKWWFAKKKKKEVVKGVSFELFENEIVGVVGESGCGKSTLAKALAGLNPLTAGNLQMFCEKPQMVFQDPYGSLNPVKTIGWLLTEPLRLQGTGTKEEWKETACEMLEKVGLDRDYYDRLPGTLSGGQRQRVAIAMAIMLKRKFILLDEPVSALDVTVQEQILILLTQLQAEYGLTYLFISHDMNVIHRICDRVFVMYQGEIVEAGDTNEVFDQPQHEYTKKLLEARV